MNRQRREFVRLLDGFQPKSLCSLEAWIAGAALAVGAVGTIAGSVIQGNAAKDAAQTEANAANNATALEKSMFDTTQSNLAPWLTGGQNALGALDYGLGIGSQKGATTAQGVGYGSLTAPFTAAQYQASPGYAFQMGQGVQAVDNSAAAAGGIKSGNTLQALTQFGQGLANSDYQQAYQNYVGQQQQHYNMLSGVSGQGANAAANLGGFSGQAAGQIGSNIIGAGNSLAAGQIGVANAASGGINSLAQLANQYGSVSQGYGSGGGTAYVPNTPYGSGANTGFYQNCDAGLKKNIKPYLFDGMSQLQVYEFHYKTQDDDEVKWRGFIAQEVLDKYPDAVKLGPNGYLRVNYAKIPAEHRYPVRVPTDEEWDTLIEEAAA